MNDALIGHTGFVGSTLLRQRGFESLFRSTNIDQIAGRRFDTIVCAGAPAQKWIANREPEADLRKIKELISHLEKVSCKRFILISTVDVFRQPFDVTEDTPIDERDLHPYGAHRRLLENFVAERFEEHVIVRLPGLVGPGLRKNIIFDLRHDNNVAAIETRSVFQFYPMVNLWYDIEIATRAGIRLIHLTGEPVSVADIAAHGFGLTLKQHVLDVPVRYDMKTVWGKLYGGSDYQYSRREIIQAVRAYAQSEPSLRSVINGSPA